MTEDKYIELIGEKKEFDLDSIKVPRLDSLATAIIHQPHRFEIINLCDFIVRNELIAQSIIVDVSLELPQQRVVPIQPIERIEIVCAVSDETFPDVYPLRKDFPITSHRNASIYPFPLGLCLYDIPFDEIKLTWNPTLFIRRIHLWLERTADGTLHPDDQQIEPFFFDVGRQLIIPPSFNCNDSKSKDKWITAYGIDRGDNIVAGPQATIILKAIDDASLQQVKDDRSVCITLCIRSAPAQHGIMHMPPTTLGELSALLKNIDVDLISELRGFISSVTESYDFVTNKNLLLLIEIPLLRHEKEESYSRVGFLTHNTIGEIGVAIDVLHKLGNTLVKAPIIGESNNESGGFKLDNFNCYDDITPKDAAVLSNTSDELLSLNFSLIGYGAIGSQIFDNLIRSGISKWTVLEPDHLMPHNLIRHPLTRHFIGFNKGKAIEQSVGTIWNDADIYLSDKKVQSLDNDEEVKKKLADSNIILDCTASQAASRTIALDIESEARRISTFLVPGGHDSVLMVEDIERKLRLDMIEAQYYRYLLRSELGENHLKKHIPKHRYGLGCRDRTLILGQEMLSLHGGILTKGIKSCLKKTSPSCAVWSANEDGSINYYDIPIEESKIKDYEGWKIVWDEFISNEMSTQRDNQLPKETGGPLIGYYDKQRKIIYVVDVLPPPEDSESGNDFFIRGCKGLEDALKEVQDRTGHVVSFVGDWHSHPEGFPPKPSNDDLLLLVNHGLEMAQDGYPGVISIISDSGIPHFYIAMKLDEIGDN